MVYYKAGIFYSIRRESLTGSGQWVLRFTNDETFYQEFNSVEEARNKAKEYLKK